jgi:hypothetical protein
MNRTIEGRIEQALTSASAGVAVWAAFHGHPDLAAIMVAMTVAGLIAALGHIAMYVAEKAKLPGM